MKNGIGFKNMKVFKDKFYFEFKDITLLTGVNNSGKSGTINALQILQENIISGSLDGLLKTEFKTRKNKNKHGSIKSFINNTSNLENNYFNLYQVINKIEYRFRIEINDGLEPFGKISRIGAFHTDQDLEIFNITILTPYGENFSCELNINYQYFVNKHKQKCSNTLGLIKEIPKLKKVCQDLNSGKLDPQKGKKYANELMQKFSVYVIIAEEERFHVGDSKFEKKWDFFITDDITFLGTNSEFDEISEIGVFFEKNNDSSIGSQQSFHYNLESFNQKYSNYLKVGIFDFNKVWKILPESQTEFENLLCLFYNTEINESYSNFSNDIITFLSISKWTMQEKYLEEFNFIPQNLIEIFTGVFLSDFGLISSLINVNKNSAFEVEYSYSQDNLINLNKNINSYDKRYEILNKKGFLELIVSLSPILLSYINKEKNHNLLQDFSQHKIVEDIQNIIHKLHLKQNCTFVSSNRFALNRTYSFEDGTDLTNLLKELEYSDKIVKSTCIEFINKWLKEFDIADELKLIPDEETGNFKIYLKQNKKNILLADYGLGTNQLLPIIFSLSLHKWKTDLFEEKIISKTVIIEEPEANLHPSMQSKLAEMFIEATWKFNVKIIAETHSEYLIRKLQYLVAKNESKISNNDIVIYYFYKPSNTLVKSKKVNQVEKIEIDKFGRLSKEFGGGFYDEADKISLDLFLLNQYNFN
jgi:predicted ATPase